MDALGRASRATRAVFALKRNFWSASPKGGPMRASEMRLHDRSGNSTWLVRRTLRGSKVKNCVQTLKKPENVLRYHLRKEIYVFIPSVLLMYEKSFHLFLLGFLDDRDYYKF